MYPCIAFYVSVRSPESGVRIPEIYRNLVSGFLSSGSQRSAAAAAAAAGPGIVFIFCIIVYIIIFKIIKKKDVDISCCYLMRFILSSLISSWLTPERECHNEIQDSDFFCRYWWYHVW